MYRNFGAAESTIEQRPLEAGQVQFIERNFGQFLEGDHGGVRLRQIHRWLFIEGKPISVVRQRLAAAVRKARVVAVTSGKGGVGKTTVSVNLAVSLAQLGWKVLLFDADLGMANTHIFAGVKPRGTLLDVLERRAAMAEVVTPGPEGIQLICGASGIADLADLGPQPLGAISRDLEQLGESYDLLLLDTGAGISSQVMHFLRMAMELIVVTTPNLAATLDAYGVVKASHEAGLTGKVRLLVNQVRDAPEAAAVAGRITGCAARFLTQPPEVLGYLLREEAVEAANQQRRPLHFSAPGSENVARLAEIAVRLCGLPSTGRRSGMAARVTPPPASPDARSKFSTAAV